MKRSNMTEAQRQICSAYDKRYREKHRKQRNEQAKEYNSKHKFKLNKQHRDWYDEHREQQKTYRRNHHKEHRNLSWKRQGIDMTEERFQAMLVAQDNRCAICECPETVIDKRTNKVKSLAVDHNHTNTKVRHLLCSHCNAALGLMKEDPMLLRKASLYLEFHKNGN